MCHSYIYRVLPHQTVVLPFSATHVRLRHVVMKGTYCRENKDKTLSQVIQPTVRGSYIRTTHSYSHVQCKVCTNQRYRKSTPGRHIISMWPHDDGGYMDFTIFVVCWQHTYSTVEKSWANFHSFLIFCFQGARRSCNFLTWSWAIVLRSFWSVFSFFSVFLFFYPCIFRWMLFSSFINPLNTDL